MKLLTIELMYVVPNEYPSSLIVDNVAINNTVADLVGRGIYQEKSGQITYVGSSYSERELITSK